jgi:hypothetical protein
MKSSKEEAEKFWTEKMEINKLMIERDKRHHEIFQLFNSSQLPNIIPIWHTNIADIDLTKQRNNLTEDLLEEGFTIIEDVDIELLFDKIYSGNREMFREKELYNNDLDEMKISDVLDNWIKGTKLIPPTILVSDKTINNSITDSNELFPTDGKHRLNVAYYYGATRIPIFVINKQLDKIKTILKTE